MKGILTKNDNGWLVKYPKYPTSNKIFDTVSLPLHPYDVNICNAYGDYSVDWIGKEVEFEIVDEFTHPKLYEGVGWGDGIKYAKLK